MTRMKTRAFTLLELLVAVTAASIVIATVFTIGAGSARHFQDQQRVAQTQMAVRTAMEALRRDVARAGFLGTPHSRVEAGRCRPPPFEIQAIEFQDNVAADTANIPNAGENFATADRLTLVGSYDASDAFHAQTFSSDGGTAFFEPTWQSFSRTFGATYTATPTFNAVAFQSVFRAGRMLRFVFPGTGGVLYATITGSNPAQFSVSFAPALPVGGDPCVPGLGTGALVSVLSRIRYSVEAPSAEFGALGAAGAGNFTGGQLALLVRREVGFDAAATPVPNRARVLLDFVADLNFSFVLDQSIAGAPQPDLQRVDGATAAPILAPGGGGAPERVRSVTISLSGRTPDQDPRFQFVPRASANDPLTRFRPNPGLPGASRVRTLRTEVGLPNLIR